MALNVAPSLIKYDRIHIPTRNAVLFRQNDTRFAKRIFPSHLYNFLIRQSRQVQARTYRLSALVHLISHIISVRTDPKMRRIYAGRIVAFVKNKFTFWNGAIGLFHNELVSEVVFPVSLDCAVPPFGNASGPNPTLTASIHFIPKTCIHFDGLVRTKKRVLRGDL